MVKLIVHEEKMVKPKGLKKSQINLEKLQEYFFADDYENLNLLDHIKIEHNKKKLSLLYPGSGADIFFPLVYLEKLFPHVKKAKFIFVDYEDNLGLIKTVLDEVGVSFKGNKKKISFYWKEQLIKLYFISKTIETHLPKQKSVDVYFERAFRLMRDDLPHYEESIITKLNPGGIIISDTGFNNHNLQEVIVPKQLSSYGEMFMGVKST